MGRLAFWDLAGICGRDQSDGSDRLSFDMDEIRGLPLQRFLGAAIGTLIPILILLPIGFSVPVGDSGTRFYDLVTNNWQPVLTQTSLFTAVLGYYLPGVLKVNRDPVINKKTEIPS